MSDLVQRARRARCSQSTGRGLSFPSFQQEIGPTGHIRHGLCATLHAQTDMYSDSNNPSSPESQIEVVLDGRRVGVPPQWRTLAAIRSYLESRALEQQRVLWSFRVVGDETGLAGVSDLMAAESEFRRNGARWLPFAPTWRAGRWSNSGCFGRSVWWGTRQVWLGCPI